MITQKHTHDHLSGPQNARQSRCLDRCLWVCHGWCQFLKSAGTVRSRFCKNRSKGYGDVAPSSEKWLQATLLAILYSTGLQTSNFFYNSSAIANKRIPKMTNAINTYCFLVSRSFKKILESIRETTQTDEMIGAAIAPFPLIAYTYVN